MSRYNRRVMRKIIQRALEVGLLLIGGMMLVWTVIPEKREVAIANLSPDAMQLKIEGQADTPAILNNRRIELAWPSTLRIGDSYTMEMNFEPRKDVPPSSAQQQGFLDIYGNYNVMAEARFEVAGLRVEPANPIRESMPSGQGLKFKWKIIADKSGIYDGTVWLSLRFLPLDGSPPSQEPVHVQSIRMQATSLLGMSAPMIRLVGGVGVVLGTAFLLADRIVGVRRRKIKLAANDRKDL